jgi:hypothetical protein
MKLMLPALLHHAATTAISLAEINHLPDTLLADFLEDAFLKRVSLKFSSTGLSRQLSCSYIDSERLHRPVGVLAGVS